MAPPTDEGEATAPGAPAQLADPAWVEIDHGALRRNLERVRRRCGSVPVCAMVKANAYGHGAVETATTLRLAGVDHFAVARVEEAIELRRGGVVGSVLVFDPLPAERRALVAEHRLTPVLSSREAVQQWRSTSCDGPPTPVHLKLDLGLTRLGIHPVDDLTDCVDALASAGAARLEGLLGHFSESEDLDGEATAEQAVLFDRALRRLGPVERVRQRYVCHLANSCAALHWPDSRLGMVRVGGALWGVDLSSDHDEIGGGLEPVMQVRARLVQVRTVPPGTRVGYGGRWRARESTRIGVAALGYGDGYTSHLAPGATRYALHRGRRLEVVGAISMDRLTLDLGPDAEGAAQAGDVVTLLGREEESPGSCMPAATLARASGDSVYEVLCRFSLRLPRVHLGLDREPVHRPEPRAAMH